MKKAMLAILLVLASCASTKTVWVKDGASFQDFIVDDGQCKAQASSTPGMILRHQEKQVRNSCMREKGWRAVEVPDD